MTLNDKSIDSVLGTQTRGGRMLRTDESTELWRHPNRLLQASVQLIQAAVRHWTPMITWLPHVVVMLPAAAAAMKHFLVPHVGPVY